jgi:hypothetical protein
MKRLAIISTALLVYPIAASAQNVVPPEIVQPDSVSIDGDVKTVKVGNAKGVYTLSCNLKADGCITPQPATNYLLFNKNTRWKLPGATEFITLQFFQDWLVKYDAGENVGLWPEDRNADFGIFLLKRWDRRTN